MSNPEFGANFTPKQKVQFALSVFLISALVATPETQQAHSVGGQEALIEKCKEKNPPQPAGLTMDDYLGIQRWGGKVHRELPYERKVSLFQRLITRTKANQLHAYEVDPARTRRIEERVSRFAAGMVERANNGDKTYKFYKGGGGAFLDGSFRTMTPFEPVPDDYEGFGWLEREVKGKEDNRRLVRYEIADNIYRRSDGTYYPHPKPYILGVQNNNAEATFEDPPALGLTVCASVPGNGATQGWRVSYYGFNFDSPNNVQTEPWLDGGATISEVQSADRLAGRFIAERYNPGIQP